MDYPLLNIVALWERKTINVCYVFALQVCLLAHSWVYNSLTPWGNPMPLSESDTRAKLIDPALHTRGWTEDLIRREETAGAVEFVDIQPRRQVE